MMAHDQEDDGPGASPSPLATVARQPILNAAWDVIAFELLCRPEMDGDARSPEAMTANVIVTGFSRDIAHGTQTRPRRPQ